VDLEEYYLKYIKPDETITCPICGERKKFSGFKNGYYKTCGNKSCSATYTNRYYKQNQIDGCKKRNKKWKNEIINGKTKQQTIIEKGKSKRNKKQNITSAKISKTLSTKDINGLTPIENGMMYKYGIKNAMHDPLNIRKLRQTSIDNFGTDWPTQSQIVKDKMKATMIDKYGVENYQQTEEATLKSRAYHFTIMKDRILNYMGSNNLTMISDLNNLYDNSKTQLKYKCNKCETEYLKCWNDIQSWWMCRKCNPFSKSSYEDELCDILDHNNIQYIRNSRMLKSSITNRMLELDIFIPSINIAIEFDGLYWHSNEHQLNDNYHLMKTELCEKQGIQLIHIFEDEWCNKKEIVKSRLFNILKIKTDNIIYARKCKIKIVDFKDKKKFLINNHMQGNDTSCINLGLYYDNLLVSLMTFSKGNISKGSDSVDGVFELSRFCNIINYRITGSASKLLFHFKKNYKWSQIFSYADRRWSQGKVYHKLEFKLDSITKPNYWYMNRSSTLDRIHRFAYRKSNLTEMKSYSVDLTEKQIMTKEGFIWIYDCGHYKFIMNNS
jgi:hypothetical protein